MSEEQKKYDPEMRGALYEDVENKGKEKYPIATGKITISGVELRIAMWPSQVSRGESKKKYWPVKIEYKQGTTLFLVPVEPKNVTATVASAKSPDGSGDAPGDGGSENVDDMPF